MSQILYKNFVYINSYNYHNNPYNYHNNPITIGVTIILILQTSKLKKGMVKVGLGYEITQSDFGLCTP